MGPGLFIGGGVMNRRILVWYIPWKGYEGIV